MLLDCNEYRTRPVVDICTGPFPEMGIKGAALATVISQGLVMSLFLYHMKRITACSENSLVKLRWQYTANILKLGFPVAAMNIYFAFINMNLARIASIYGGHLGIMSQTTGGQIEGITWNSSSGFSTALGSFTAQNFAANKIKRALSAYRVTLILMGILGSITSFMFIMFGDNIFSLFVSEKKPTSRWCLPPHTRSFATLYDARDNNSRCV